MEHFVFIRITFWIALLLFTIAVGLISWMIEKLAATIGVFRRKREGHGAIEDILVKQDG